ncbi:hypothetical protein F2Q68_00037283 [Brassica cretica]|uniref:JmjC domain-containing protein n=1 Tax=Brassica cretica TaxID=69181 RepID=A0A8S9H0N5_BRACR|nr:hypothetical protein F2Q68_00037283 [Brassica cretica]
MVDILLHVTETVVTTKLICRIRKLMQNIRRLRRKNPEKRKESRGKIQDRIDSESSQHCLGRDLQVEGRENCNGSCEEESISNACGAQWDVSHPLLEQSYYLDEYHKARLKEEFVLFDQCVGEAVIVPAGCPYQNRKNKSCVNVVLNFLSPEHATESIKLVDELNQLPQRVKTKANKIKVKKMAIYKVSEAIKEIRELTSADSTAASRI